jgi:hypothetical protein
MLTESCRYQSSDAEGDDIDDRSEESEEEEEDEEVEEETEGKAEPEKGIFLSIIYLN